MPELRHGNWKEPFDEDAALLRSDDLRRGSQWAVYLTSSELVSEGGPPPTYSIRGAGNRRYMVAYPADEESHPDGQAQR